MVNKKLINYLVVFFEFLQMSETSQIQLNISSILKVPLEKYGNDFVFIVNGEEFKTSRLISDIISPAILRNHLIDPTFDRFTINTNHRGNFSNILNLVNFKDNEIPKKEIEFVAEVIEILENDNIKVDFHNPTELTLDNVLDQILFDQQFPKIYSKRLLEEIDIISSHFFELCESQSEKMEKVDLNLLFEIVNNRHLKLNDEDQLLNFVNKLYSNDHKYSILYETVYFLNATTKSMNNFLNIYDINDISEVTWLQLSERLSADIEAEKTAPKENFDERYRASPKRPKGIEFPMTDESALAGIIAHLKKETGNEIGDEIDFASSSCFSDVPINISLFENKNKYFISKDLPGSWVSLHFKKHQVVPTHYTIRTYGSDSNPHPRSWVIEGSNDSNTWVTLDTQRDCEALNKGWIVHTFNVSNQQPTPFKYIRMKLTDKTWNCNNHELLLDSFELYGTLI